MLISDLLNHYAGTECLLRFPSVRATCQKTKSQSQIQITNHKKTNLRSMKLTPSRERLCNLEVALTIHRLKILWPGRLEIHNSSCHLTFLSVCDIDTYLSIPLCFLIHLSQGYYSQIGTEGQSGQPYSLPAFQHALESKTK